MRSLILTVSVVLLAALSVSAEPIAARPWSPLSTRAFGASWSSCGPAAAPRASFSFASAAAAPLMPDAQPLHAAAIEHSDAYQTRAKIHKYASFATLPLFAVELALGESLYNTPETGAKKGAHAAVGAGIVGLFGVNTVTGAWNLFGEGWKDTDGRTLRVIHGLLMMAADVGFLATEASAPNSGGRTGALTFETDKVTHRNIAIASMSIATAGYLIMLFGNH